MIVKRGVLLLVFILLLAGIAEAQLNLTLSREQFGTEQPLDGILEIDLTEPLPKDAILTFTLNAINYGNRTLETLASGYSGITELEQKLLKSGEPVSSAVMDFEKAGAKLEYAFDLSQGNVFETSDVEDVESFNMKIRGSTFRGGSPTSPTFNIGNDNDIEWIYKGPRKPGVFLPVNDSYLGNRQLTGESILIGDSDNIVCQNITLPPASKYKVKTFAKFLDTTATLKAVISDQKESNFLDICLDRPCCTFPNKPTSLSEMSCDIDIDVNDEDSYYVCVFPEISESAFLDDDAISIAYKTPLEGYNAQGYYGGRSAGFNYFLWTEFEDFERRLSTVETLAISDEASAEVKRHAKAPLCTNDCLLVPLNITSLSPGKVTLEDLQLRVKMRGPRVDVTSFTPVAFRPESLQSNTTTLKIQLRDYTDLLTPTVEGEGFQITASLAGKVSNAASFDIVPGPNTNIRFNSLLLQPGDPLIVNGEATAIENRSIVSYEWDFGDGTTASGADAQHTYAGTGMFVVTLTVTDSENIAGVSTVIVEVNTASLPEQILETEETLDRLEAKLAGDSDLADVVNTLGLQSVLSKTRSDFTTLKADFEATGGSTTTEEETTEENNETEMSNETTEMGNETEVDNEITGEAVNNGNTTSNETETAEGQEDVVILERLRAIREALPKDITAESPLNFDASIETVNDIPSSINIPLEDQAERKVLAAQADANLQGSARIVRITYLDDREENFILVEKTVSGLSGEIYEIFPTTVVRKEEITEFQEAVSNNILKFGSQNIVYTVEGSTLDDLTAATQIHTLVVPNDLSSYTVEGPADDTIKLDLGECGDGFCEAGEDESICPQDCKKKRPIALIVALLIVLIIGVVWIFVYKGLYSFHYFFGPKPVSSRQLFKSEKDYQAVKKYVTDSKAKGFNDQQIALALRKQKWTMDQVKGILMESRGMSPKGKAKPKAGKAKAKPAAKKKSRFGIKIKK